MKVVILNDFRVEAQLSEKELEQYGITYRDIDYGNIETRRFLWSVAGDITAQCGIRVPLSGKVLIEVIKDGSDLYRICFSSLGSPLRDEKSLKQLVKTEEYPLVAEFSDIEYIISCLPKLGYDCKSALFEKNGKYRMIFDVSGNEKDDIFSAVCEFTDYLESSRLETARCRENWNCIISDNAVKKLSECF